MDSLEKSHKLDFKPLRTLKSEMVQIKKQNFECNLSLHLMLGKINERHRGSPNASKNDPAGTVCPRGGVFHISAEASFTPPSAVTVDFHSSVHQ